MAPTPSLLPSDPRQRAHAIGPGHERLGEGGIAWNRRLQMLAGTAASGNAGRLAPLMDKYGFDAADAAAAGARIAATLRALAVLLAAQEARGVPWFVGETLSAVDIWWVATANIVAALDPALLAHRDRVFKACFRDPMAF